MKNQIKVPVNLLKILKAVQGTNNVFPVAQCLNIKKEGWIGVTDGATAFITNPLESKLSQDYFIKFNWISFSTIAYAIIDFNDCKIKYYNKKDEEVSSTVFEIVDVKSKLCYKEVVRKHKRATDGEATIDPTFISLFSNFEKGEDANIYVGADETPTLVYGKKTGMFVIAPKTKIKQLFPDHLR